MLSYNFTLHEIALHAHFDINVGHKSGMRGCDVTEAWHNAAFTRIGLTTRYRIKSLYKSIFVLSKSRDI